MAAKNSDSKRIFDLYIDRYLTEQDGEPARSKEATEPGKGVNAAKQERAQAVSGQTSGQTPTTATSPFAPGKAGVEGEVEKYATTPPPQKTWNLQNAAVYPPGPLANPTPGQQAQMKDEESDTDPNPEGYEPKDDPDPNPEGYESDNTTPQSTLPAGAPSDSEKNLLRQLHASDYNPNSTTDKKRLEELRVAQSKLKEKLGREPSIKELATASYAQQYGEKSPYYAQAQKMGLDLGRPGRPTGAQTGQPTGAQTGQPTGAQTGQPTGAQTGQQSQSNGDVTTAQAWGDQKAQQYDNFINQFGQAYANYTPQQKAWFKSRFGKLFGS